MENPERLIGKKIRGFKFDRNTCCGYSEQMDKYIGKIGTIEMYYNNSFEVQFKDSCWLYPADQIEAHLVEDETFTFNANHNKMKLKDEIPTLSDGVMMLVSDDGKNWEKYNVIGQKNNLFYAWVDNMLVYFGYVKPLEPTKEEQLTAILGSSEKVSEIMELFKN